MLCQADGDLTIGCLAGGATHPQPITHRHVIVIHLFPLVSRITAVTHCLMLMKFQH